MMMQMPWVVAVLFLLFVLVAGGAYVIVRILVAKTVHSDHPR